MLPFSLLLHCCLQLLSGLLLRLPRVVCLRTQTPMYSKRAARATSWVGKLTREVHARLRVPQNRSITVLSQQLPLRLMLTRMPGSFRKV
jgi:hypothetical protein